MADLGLTADCGACGGTGCIRGTETAGALDECARCRGGGRILTDLGAEVRDLIVGMDIEALRNMRTLDDL